jgi:S-adenosylmethionine synthetase
MELAIHSEISPDAREVEIVERKGSGHPDTLCDGIAEAVCVALCREYLARFGAILHHNVDKVLLVGGAAHATFGGGEVRAPIEIYLAGRATREVGGAVVPVDEIAVEACRAQLRATFPELDLERHARVVPRIRSGSVDLARLFARGRVPLANDTSCGAGFAPLTALERTVLEVDRALAGSGRRELGADTKVMGLRRGARIELTVCCAIVARHVRDLGAYRDAKAKARELALAAARRASGMEVEVVVNAADNEASGDIYLTVTGSSAEAGDDGEVGRGNRIGGLITPYRPMTLEAAAGKNPQSHVGKLYGVLAHRIAASIADREPVRGASCVLLGRIGRPIDDPLQVDVGLVTERPPEELRGAVHACAAGELARLAELRAELLEGKVALF